jgi:two-component system NtrC family sensor kinase
MNGCVLIVDDSLTVRMDLASSFESAGFHVHACGSIEDARAILRAHAVGGIVLDVHLPDGNGVEFMQELRAGNHTAPILMLSSEAEVRSRIRGLQAGADEYVGKPYDRDFVVARAGELMRSHRGAAKEDCILLIDDSLTVREDVGAALREAGYRLLTASSGEEGLRLVALHRPSLVIVDGDLPDISGATVIRRIRLDAALRQTPCLMFTGSTGRSAESAVLDAGADAFLHKEESTALLLARVAAVLRAAARPMEAVSAPLGVARVLAVDDSPTYLHGLADALEGEGFDLVLASSGEEAMEMLAVQPVDCILMDLSMPGMGGGEACRRLKSVQGLREIPLVLLTSSTDRERMVEGLEAGADDCVSKSLDVEVLRARIRALLRRKQLHDEGRRMQAEVVKRELQAAEARASQELAQARAGLISELEAKNLELEAAYRELKSAQVQLIHSAKMASLGQLVAGIAHEINNPLAYVTSNLSNITGWLEQLGPNIRPGLEDDLLGKWERIEKRLRSASEGVERVKELVLKLRTFSRLDEGEFKTIEVPDTIDSVLSFLEHRLEGGRIEIVRRHAPPTQLRCFPSALNQVIMNLLSNAIEAIEGEGTITIATGADQERFFISVADTGRGLPPGGEERLFDPFFTTKAIGEGTGLGLSISFGIMQSHRGSISARNRPEGGSEFLLEIPLDLAERLGHLGQ